MFCRDFSFLSKNYEYNYERTRIQIQDKASVDNTIGK